MKKSILFIAAIATLVSCNKELGTTENAESKIIDYNDGICVFAKADGTKVTVDVENSASVMKWEAGDEITVYHNGKTSTFVTTESGTTAKFIHKTPADKITEVDPTKPFIAYYNVTSVGADGKATFSIAAEQTEGESSNKVTLCAYSATTTVGEDDVIDVTFAPVVAVLEFNINAGVREKSDSKFELEYNVTKFVLTPTAGATGYTVMTSGTIDPATKAVTPTGTSRSPLSVTLKEGETDIVGGRNVKLIVGNVTMDNTGATMDWYKGDVKNYTKNIWASKKVESYNEGKPVHIYQPIAEKKVGLAQYNDYYNEFFKRVRDEKQGEFITLCDDEGAVILTNHIVMNSGTTPSTNRICVVSGFTGTLDGRGYALSNVFCDDTGKDPKTGLFQKLSGTIKNLNFGQSGKNNYITYHTTSSQLFAPIISMLAGSRIENCHNYINYTVTPVDADKTYVSGIVADMKGGTIENCSNEATLSIVAETPVNLTNNTVLLAGIAATGGTAECSVKDCTNNGVIALSGKYCLKAAYIGGIFATTYIKTIVDGCENKGAITITGESTETLTNMALEIGGIIGRFNQHSSEVKNCTNYADISGTSVNTVKTMNVAGIAGDIQTSNVFTNNTNRGSITAYKDASNKAGARWYAAYGANNTIVSGSVLAGITLNGNTVKESNYKTKGCMGVDPSEAMTITLLTE